MGEIPSLHSRESEYFTPFHSSRRRSNREYGAVLAFPRKEGDGSDGVPFFGPWIRSLLG